MLGPEARIGRGRWAEAAGNPALAPATSPPPLAALAALALAALAALAAPALAAAARHAAGGAMHAEGSRDELERPTPQGTARASLHHGVEKGVGVVIVAADLGWPQLDLPPGRGLTYCGVATGLAGCSW